MIQKKIAMALRILNGVVGGGVALTLMFFPTWVLGNQMSRLAHTLIPIAMIFFIGCMIVATGYRPASLWVRILYNPITNPIIVLTLFLITFFEKR